MTNKLTLADIINTHYVQVPMRNREDGPVKFSIYECKQCEGYVTRTERSQHFREKHTEFYKAIRDAYDREVKNK